MSRPLAYYNEIDFDASAQIGALISGGHIMPGRVDARSIVHVRPADVAGYERCHFFAGWAAWDYALALAGWPEGRAVWTGSCPCQPWTRAGAVHGRNRGFEDERHLWPAWLDLIRECRPDTILGEQVPDAIAEGWWDAVATDLEGAGYACGALVFRASDIGEPIARKRLYFVAQHLGSGTQGQFTSGSPCPARPRRWRGEADLRAVTDAPLVAGDRWPQPLVRRVDHGRAECMGLLHRAGNAINAEAAAAFIAAALDTLPSPTPGPRAGAME
ncbi:DNA cytosine methyltransferase [Methylorubrum salsuginis]|uniref:DNA (Cytosine-5)-methyltransferase 1 n=1 Tax=Methylorubrum salsuginis TaxID=414703 RepID=A0A1I4FJB3_9HYPH|nr:DNA cytosine methyltransferase [Methylorubrum salsuginis]SFL17563.1 DNA (cytosine-5)-methyltransferase 1 [Methylorubrum salsuginis]